MIPLRDADEIASVERNAGLGDIVGGRAGDTVYGYDWSIERHRQRSSAGKEGGQS